VYTRCGYFWEPIEQEHLKRFLQAVAHSKLAPLVTLDMPARDLMPAHWSVTGRDVPDAASDDVEVFLPGRNVLLLAKAMVWCQLNGIREIALATLAGNPFSDATSTFFHAFEHAVGCALGIQILISHPFSCLSKREVMNLGKDLPLALTFSCIHPVEGIHCGQCNKCAERRKGFREAGLSDPTAYAASLQPPREN
jgi:7-cyano-7-deazaguanine synthase